jgi:hypothetical protein
MYVSEDYGDRWVGFYLSTCMIANHAISFLDIFPPFHYLAAVFLYLLAVSLLAQR